MCSDWLIAQQPNHSESRECHNQCILTNRPSHISTEMSRSAAFRNSEKIGSSGFAGVFAIAWDPERCQSLGNLRVSTASSSTAVHFLFFDPALGTSMARTVIRKLAICGHRSERARAIQNFLVQRIIIE